MTRSSGRVPVEDEVDATLGEVVNQCVGGDGELSLSHAAEHRKTAQAVRACLLPSMAMNCRARERARVAWFVVFLSVFAAACGSDDDASTAEVATDATTCQELVDEIDFTEISEDDAILVASRMYEIAGEQVADGGVVDEEFPCSTIIRRIEDRFPDAVTDGYRKVELDDETKSALAELWGTPG